MQNSASMNESCSSSADMAHTQGQIKTKRMRI
jgi:hypothetical protein